MDKPAAMTFGVLLRELRVAAGLTQQELDAIAWKLNTRPRKLHGFRSPIEVYDEHLAKARTRPDL